jgi:hypothetical protein
MRTIRYTNAFKRDFRREKSGKSAGPACGRIMREPAMAARMRQLGMVMEENGTANYVAFMQRDIARYAQLVKKLHLQEAK